MCKGGHPPSSCGRLVSDGIASALRRRAPRGRLDGLRLIRSVGNRHTRVGRSEHGWRECTVATLLSRRSSRRLQRRCEVVDRPKVRQLVWVDDPVDAHWSSLSWRGRLVVSASTSGQLDVVVSGASSPARSPCSTAAKKWAASSSCCSRVAWSFDEEMPATGVPQGVVERGGDAVRAKAMRSRGMRPSPHIGGHSPVLRRDGRREATARPRGDHESFGSDCWFVGRAATCRELIRRVRL